MCTGEGAKPEDSALEAREKSRGTIPSFQLLRPEIPGIIHDSSLPLILRPNSLSNCTFCTFKTYTGLLWSECLCPLPSNSHVEILMSTVKIVGGGALGRCLSQEGGTLINEVSAFIKQRKKETKNATELPNPFCHVRIQGEVCNPERAFTRTLGWHSDLGFPVSRTVSNEFPPFISHPVLAFCYSSLNRSRQRQSLHSIPSPITLVQATPISCLSYFNSLTTGLTTTVFPPYTPRSTQLPVILLNVNYYFAAQNPPVSLSSSLVGKVAIFKVNLYISL